jgi:DNA mismatch endonuclease (patch repair protein)
MADRLTPEGRSALMGRIKGKDTLPEMTVRRMLHGLGYRYVLHDKRLPGKPDLAFPARRKAVFVHGCFWHGHDCGRGFKPAKNADFWASKIDRNSLRDRQQIQALHALGWEVLTVWECETKRDQLDSCRRRLIEFLSSKCDLDPTVGVQTDGEANSLTDNPP